MAAESSEFAEQPKEGELWQEMIARQRSEGNAQPGYLRGILRSLPDEQKQEKEELKRGELDTPKEANVSGYQVFLRDASHGAERERDRGIDR
jgi:hypothetical protein